MSTNGEKDMNWVHIAVLIDRSGSMQSMDTSELAGAATTLIKEQQDKPDSKVTATVANFDNQFEIIKRNHDAKDLVISASDIEPRGMTALSPSLGRMITLVDMDITQLTEEKPGTVVFILLSDGEQTCDHLDNRDTELDAPFEGGNGYKAVAELVQKKEKESGWKFFMMGTNFDAIKEGPRYGFTPQTCINYSNTTDGGTAALRSTSQAVRRFRNDDDPERSSNFDGYTQGERDESVGISHGAPADAGPANVDPAVRTFSHRQHPHAPWEPYTPEQSELIGKAIDAIPSGAIMLSGTRFEVRWGGLATSRMMRTPPPSNIIQVNMDTGYTREVKQC